MFTPFTLNDHIMPNGAADEDDVLKTKSALRLTGDYKVPDWGLTNWPDQPMHDGLKAFQEREGLDPDGWMRPGGPTERTLNAALFERSDDSRDGSAGVRVSASVGPGGVNRPDDVKRAKSALGDLGLYPAARAARPDDDAEDDPDFTFAVSTFERGYRLPVTGRIDPGSAAATRLERLTRQFAVQRLAQNSLRGGTNPTTARTVTVPAPPPTRPAPTAKPAPAPKPKAGTEHQHKALNHADFDDPAFGGWSPGGADTRKKQRVMPIPAYRNQVVNQQDWVAAHRAAENLGLGKGETRAFLEMFAAEGGTRRDSRGSAVGGIMNRVLRAHGPKIGINAKNPASLTMEERFRVYKSFLDQKDYFGMRGGTNYLNSLGDPEVAAAVADAMFEGGSDKTPLSIQRAANQVAITPTSVGRGFGPETDRVLREAIRNPAVRRRFLDALAQRRVIDTKRNDARFDHFRFSK